MVTLPWQNISPRIVRDQTAQTRKKGVGGFIASSVFTDPLAKQKRAGERCKRNISGSRVNKFALLLIAAMFSWSGGVMAQERWQGAWAHPPTAHNDLSFRPDERPRRTGYVPLPPYKDATVRQVVRLSAAARAIKLRFTNEFGARPLHLGSAHVALAAENGAIVPGTDHVITFAGRTSVDIPPGAPMLGDAITWPLPAFARLAISIYYPDETVPPAHTIFILNAWQTSGDHTSDVTFTTSAKARSGIHLAQIDIVPAAILAGHW